jgi:hypothetical protein
MKMDIDNDFCNAYVRLRTVLDALEMHTLNIVLRDEDTITRIKRAKEIEEMLTRCYNEIFKPDVTAYAETFQTDGNCPEGYQNCNGVCVPYNCP